VRSEVSKLLFETNTSEEFRRQFLLAVDEAVSSVIFYCIDKGYKQKITLTIDADDIRVKATVDDPMNVFEINNCDETELAQRIAFERRYGLSLFLMRHLIDEITYSYKKGFENSLVLAKFIIEQS
jgi:anti-sigma regulatory factor (Ser/Thr protein kinase)